MRTPPARCGWAPARTQFRYRLEGFDPDWVDPETRREAIYADLPAGDYRFQVIARNNRGVWNRAGAVLELSVPPPFYQAAWFYAAGGIALVSFLLAAWKIREVQIHRRYALILAERARLSREIHDTLLQSLVGVALQFDVHRGKRPIASADVQSRLAERNRHKHITPRELQVIELVSQGMRNKQIAASLGISEETAQVHLRNIYLKLNVNDRTAVLAVAVRRGLIHLQ